ncbi:hypothetical protein SLEP1_g3981 [Rubroshorea leprosula]|uniref:PGG domain-containing protein n=1 Tax=Rubroshorea leprosula TaxID=152421 RepID=A0AAV5HWM2_9ROSI|nr:hypothetical protein SLEP1_g3981 [Rubroshorea leprosula]
MAKEVVLASIRSGPENVEVMKEPYEKALKNEWESIKTVYQNKRGALFHSLTPRGDTVFHIAAYKGSIELLRVLFEMVPEPRKWEVLTMKNIHGNTLLHEAATSKNVEAAKFLLENADGEQAAMLMNQNESGETPLYRAAALGAKATVEYLANAVEMEVGTLQGNFIRGYDNLPVLHIAVSNEQFETAIWLLDKDPELAMLKDSDKTCLHLLGSMSTAFKSSSKKISGFKEFIYRFIPNDLLYSDETDQHVPCQCCKTRKDHQPMTEWNYIKEIREKKRKYELVGILADALVKKDSSSWRNYYKSEVYNTNICFLRDKETVGGEESGEASSQTGGIGTAVVSPSDAPLIIAASTGILEIVEMIHKEYPQALEHVTQNGQNILHVAILYRQYHIYEYLKDKEKGGAMNLRLALGMDNDGETILHKAARTEYYHEGNKWTVALNLQEEITWFKDVAKMLPASYTIHRNKKNKTARQLFKDQHKEQLKDAQEWVKNTCQSCSAVAVLVATVVYTAAFTAPGGFNEYGRPIFEERPLYSFFTVVDVAGLASSLTSVVLFLSVLTSSLDLKDFKNDIPRKLSFGFLFLTFAIATTVLSFTAAIILTVHLKKAWTTSLTYAAAFLPVAVYAIVQCGLYIKYFKIALISIFDFVKKFLPGI